MLVDPPSTPFKQLLWWTWTPTACQEKSPLTSCNEVKQLQLSLQREKTKFGVSFSVQFISKLREQHRVWHHASGSPKYNTHTYSRSSRANHGCSICTASSQLTNRYDEHFTRLIIWFIVCCPWMFFLFFLSSRSCSFRLIGNKNAIRDTFLLTRFYERFKFKRPKFTAHGGFIHLCKCA